MTLDEMRSLHEQGREAPETEPIETDEGDFEDQSVVDLKNGIKIMGTTFTLLNYLSDPNLVKSLNKHQRETIRKTAEKIRNWLVEAESTYTE